MPLPMALTDADAASGAPPAADSARVTEFLERKRLPTPVLVMDVELVLAHYRALQRALPEAVIYYAVKANPLPQIVRALAAEGSCFDVASAAEVEDCLGLGIPPRRLSFGHTVKKASAIGEARDAGIDLFSCDSIGELRKIARHAPLARVMVRLATGGAHADWPLSRKFGCDPLMARDLLIEARRLGLSPYGVSFHVGSQQTDPGQWNQPIALAAALFRDLQTRGIVLQALNLGGGFPARYSKPVPPVHAYGALISQALHRAFGRRVPQVFVEPGRYLVGNAGIIESEVVLIARKSSADGTPWVYIDCGRFGGLAETMDEAIRYRLRVRGRHGEPIKAILAGPTCDSADVLYEKSPCQLPCDLEEGDRVQILSAGAYTCTYASVGFNGFAPLQTVCI